MIKRLLVVLLMLVMIGCAAGGKECPDMDTTLYYSLSDGSIVMEMMGRGELAKGGGHKNEINAVMSDSECKELVLKYKKERVNELEKSTEERYNER